MGHFTFSILGPLQVLVDGEPVRIAGAKAQAVLAVLALRRGEPVTTEELIEALWDDEPPPTARTALQVHVSRVRKALTAAGAGDVLVTKGTAYALDLDPDALDLTRFDRLVEEGRAALADSDPSRARELLANAEACWRGPVLGGLRVPGISAGELAALDERRAAATVLRIEADLALGHSREVLAELETLRAASPLNERYAELTALALYAAGRPADALGALARLRSSLSHELGIDPGPSVRNLEAAIVSGDLEPLGPAPDGEDPGVVHEGRRTISVVACRQAQDAEDPEARRASSSELLEQVSSIVNELEGDVLEAPSGSVVAVFGVPLVHEDDALRAARAAIAIRDVDPEVRVGVATGEVLVEDTAGGRTLLSTDPVDLAGELSRRARPGELLTDHASARRMSGHVGTEPAEVILLTDGGSPINAYRLTALAPEDGRRLRAPLMGREVELGGMREAFHRALDGEPQLVAIFGPAGIGKTRLVEEAIAAAGVRAYVGHCLPYGRDITLWPIAEIIRQLAGISESDSSRRARGRITAVLKGEGDAAFVGDQVAAALGLTDAMPAPDELFWAIRRFLEAATSEQPAIVVVDDLHWADDTLLDLLEHVVATARRARLLVVAVARPELLERRSAFGGRAGATTLQLDPLPQDATRDLMDRLLAGTSLDDATRLRIEALAEGNPLFVEEVLGMLIDDGHLRSHEGRWEPVADLASVPLPPSIRALLEARIDRLPEREQAVLEAASIIGKEFSVQDLRDLRPDEPPEELTATLEALARRDLVRLESVTRRGGRLYRFHHILLRDVAEQGTPKRVRAQDHERVAEALELRAGDRLSEVEEIVGYHLERAWALTRELGSAPDRVRSLGTRAATRLAASARRAVHRDDMPAAGSLITRALACLSPDDARRAEWELLRGTILFDLGRFDDARESVEAGLRDAERSGDEGIRWRLLLQRETIAAYHEPREHGAEGMRTLAEAAVEAFERLEDHTGLARAHRLHGDALMLEGRLDEALEAFRRARHHSEMADDGDGRLDAAWLFGLHGPMPLAVYIEEAEAAMARATHITPEVLARVGFALAMAGRADDATEMLADAVARMRELGAEFRIADALMHQGAALLFTGDDESAADSLEAAVITLERLGERSVRSTALALLAEAWFRLGRDDDAAHAAEESESLTAPDDPASGMAWRQVKAKVLARQGHAQEAERLARDAAAIADPTDFVAMRAAVHADLAWVLEASGRPGEAVTEWEQALELYEQKGVARDAAARWIDARPSGVGSA